jgi:CBS domain-containing protein
MSPRAAWRLESLGFREVYDYVPGKADWLAAGLPSEGEEAGAAVIGQVVRRDVPTCALDDRAGDALKRAAGEGWDQCVVVNEERVVLGRLRAEAAQKGEAHVADVMEDGPSTFRPNVGVVEMAEYMARRGRMRDALVTDAEGRLLGVILREDMESILEQTHDHHPPS